MNKVEAFAAQSPAAAGFEPLTLVEAGPVTACTVDVAEGAALGFAWIAHAAQRAARAGVRNATATRDIGFRPGSSVPGGDGVGAPGGVLAAHQLIDVLAGLA
jgi:hypothetical protein